MVKYYYVGGTRIAMRTGGSVNTAVKWLLGDHLGSTSVTTDYDGDLLSRTLYKPWGEVRYQSGTLPTKYTYTGQYSHTADFGLMYYNARWYDSSLGRFAQADSMVPGAGNPMAWDRYAYTFNNPINYTDPNGHAPTPCSGANCFQVQISADKGTPLRDTLNNLSQNMDYVMTGTFLKGTISAGVGGFLTERILAAPTLEIPQPVSVAGGLIVGLGIEVATVGVVWEQIGEQHALDDAVDHMAELEKLGLGYIATFDSKTGFFEICSGAGEDCQNWTFEEKGNLKVLEEFFTLLDYEQKDQEDENGNNIYLPVVSNNGSGGSGDNNYE
jgi:RHS repeat-associated protein